MKKQSVFFSLLMILSASADAQDLSRECRLHMQHLSPLAGRWKGEAVITQQGSAGVTVNQDENIEFRLDSLVLQIEGVGKSKSDPSKITFHALGFVSYHAAKQQFEMKSFLKDGKQTEAFFRMTERNQFDWGFDVPDGKIQYHIAIDPVLKKWNEVGKYSPDGIKWFPFFEMNLSKLP
jgi:hypothetical protein